MAKPISQSRNISRPWLAADDAVLVQMAAVGATADQVARKLRRTKAAVQSRAHQLNVSLQAKRSLKTAPPRPEAPPDYRGS